MCPRTLAIRAAPDACRRRRWLRVEQRSGRHAVLVATLDNLLKGAATQALQNINLACGFDELAGMRRLPGQQPA